MTFWSKEILSIIGYDDIDDNKIISLLMEEKSESMIKTTRTLKVSYPDDNTIHVMEHTTGVQTKEDVITLNDKGKVSKFVTDDRTEWFDYDEFGNIIKWTIDNQGYKTITYDSYNGVFSYFNAPQWLLLYTTEHIIGTGANNVLSINSYEQNGKLIEAIDYTYDYNSKTRYPRTYTYTTGGEEFRGIVSLRFEFPYK